MLPLALPVKPVLPVEAELGVAVAPALGAVTLAADLGCAEASESGVGRTVAAAVALDGMGVEADADDADDVDDVDDVGVVDDVGLGDVVGAIATGGVIGAVDAVGAVSDVWAGCTCASGNCSGASSGATCDSGAGGTSCESAISIC